MCFLFLLFPLVLDYSFSIEVIPKGFSNGVYFFYFFYHGVSLKGGI